MKLRFSTRDGLEDNILEINISKEDLKKLNNELEMEECSFATEEEWKEWEYLE